MFTDKELIEKNTIGMVDLYGPYNIVLRVNVNISWYLFQFYQLRLARFYDANEGRLDSTIAQLHNHVNLSLAAKECFQSDYQSIISQLF